MDFFVLNEGTESDYLKLEQVWKEYQMDAVEKGEKLGWMVFKVNKRNGEPIENTSYVVVNDYKSKEQFENQGKNWSWANFNSIVRSRLKGKMSSSTIRRVLAKMLKKKLTACKDSSETVLHGLEETLKKEMSFLGVLQKH
jgi:hypothetical protein